MPNNSNSDAIKKLVRDFHAICILVEKGILDGDMKAYPDADLDGIIDVVDEALEREKTLQSSILVKFLEKRVPRVVPEPEAKSPEMIGRKLFNKGDEVRVWSLQSFVGGGFLDGAPAVVRQGQDVITDSVLVAVYRKGKDGNDFLDMNYEVYAKQLEPIPSALMAGNLDEYLSKIREVIAEKQF